MNSKTEKLFTSPNKYGNDEKDNCLTCVLPCRRDGCGAGEEPAEDILSFFAAKNYGDVFERAEGSGDRPVTDLFEASPGSR